MNDFTLFIHFVEISAHTVIIRRDLKLSFLIKLFASSKFSDISNFITMLQNVLEDRRVFNQQNSLTMNIVILVVHFL